MSILSTKFKIPGDRGPLDAEDGSYSVVTGQLVARAAGLYHRLEVIREPDGRFIVIVGMDYNEQGFQFTTHHQSEAKLHEWLCAFDGPGRAHWFLCTEAQLERWSLDPAEVRQDLLEVVDAVLRDVGGYAPRP